MLKILNRLRINLIKFVTIIFRTRRTKRDEDDDDPYGLDNFNYPLF